MDISALKTIRGSDSGHDQSLEWDFMKDFKKVVKRAAAKDELGFSPRRVVHNIPAEDIFYIYRFGGTGSYHLSAYGWDGNGTQVALAHAIKHGIKGVHEIKPHWSQDFSQMVEEAVLKISNFST